MATINETSIEFSVPAQTRLTTWELFKSCVSHLFESCMCGVPAEVLEDYKRDELIRQQARMQLYATHGTARADVDPVDAIIQEVIREDHHNMGTIEHVYGVVKPTRDDGEDMEFNAVLEALDMDPKTLQFRGREKPRIYARFVSQMALYIQSTLGKMKLTDANVLLVERKYNEVCRKRHVRLCDQSRHRQHVINAVFTEHALDMVGTARIRLPLWYRWLNGIKTETSDREVC